MKTNLDIDKKSMKKKWKAYCKKNSIKTYAPGLVSFLLYIILFVVSVACIFVFPFLLRLVASALAQCNWLSQPLTQANSNETGLSLLPDFLGGMAGILVGFILDFAIIEKLKIVRQYQSMLKPLDAELDKFKNLKLMLSDIEQVISEYTKKMRNIPENKMERFSSDDIVWYNKLANGVGFRIPKKWNETQFLKLLEKVNLVCCAGLSLPHIERRIVDDIIADYENSAAIYRLPFSSKEFGIADTLYDINCKILLINVLDNDRLKKNSYEALQTLISEGHCNGKDNCNDLIRKYFAITKVWKRDNSIAQEWLPNL